MSSNQAQPASTGATAAAGAPARTDKPAATLPNLGILEEDDEFEDFPVEEWDEDAKAKAEVHAWEDNWDDDDATDDFAKQLRAEFQKLGDQMQL
ncbi:hypothetical protein GGF31_008267 [Allomyces arbusculus]|nr:hypothetical protein GGF31_008267 [Allomyces arbusculus]